MFYNLVSPYFLSTFLHMILFVQDDRKKVGDRIVPVEDQPLAGLSVDEVQPTGGVVHTTWSMFRLIYWFVTCLFSLPSCVQLDFQTSGCCQDLYQLLPESHLFTISSNIPVTSQLMLSWVVPLFNPSFSSSSFFNNTQTCHVRGSDSMKSAQTTSDFLCCPVLAGRECTIEICKGNLGLGLSIVGGCDTVLVRSANVLCFGFS